VWEGADEHPQRIFAPIPGGAETLYSATAM